MVVPQILGPEKQDVLAWEMRQCPLNLFAVKSALEITVTSPLDSQRCQAFHSTPSRTDRFREQQGLFAPRETHAPLRPGALDRVAEQIYEFRIRIIIANACDR